MAAGLNADKYLAPKIVFFILGALIGLAYFNSLHTPFYYDDFTIILGNKGLTSFRYLPYLFQQKNYFTFFVERTYRPVNSLVYFFLYQVVGPRPLYWRLFNLFVHLINCLLFFLLLKRLRLPAWFSLLAASIFAVHPVHSEMFNVVSFNEDIIGGFFCLLAFYLYLRAGRLWLPAAVLMYLLSCFTKETFIALPALLLAFELWLAEEKQRGAFGRLAWFLIAALVFLYVNLFIMKNPSSQLKVPYPGGSLSSALLTFAVVLIYYLKLFFLPTGLTPVYDFPIYSSFSDWRLNLSLVLLGALAVLISCGFRKRLAFAPFLAWFFLFLLPTANILPFWSLLAERYLYFPLLGLIPGILLLMKWLWELGKYDFQKPALLLGIVFLVFLGGLTVKRNQVWQDPVTLWEDTIQKAPAAPQPYGNLAAYYYAQKEYRLAIAQYKKVIRANPTRYPHAYYTIGRSYLALGEFAEAAEYLKKAVASKDGYENPVYYSEDLYYLGLAFYKLGDYPAAYKYWQRAQKITPAEVTLKNYLAEIEKKLPAQKIINEGK